MRSYSRLCFAAALLGLAFAVGCNPEQPVVPPDSSANKQAKEDAKDTQTQVDPIKQAMELLKKGDPDAAAAATRKALVANPNDQRALTLMLNMFIAKKDTASAVETLDRLAELNSKRQDEFNAHAANLLLASGEVDGALDRLRILLKRSPGYDQGRRIYAQALDRHGNPFDANEQIRYLIGRMPMNQEALYGLMSPDRSFATIDAIPGKSEAEVQRINAINIARMHIANGAPRKAIETLEKLITETGKTEPVVGALMARSLANAQEFSRLEGWLAGAPNSNQRYFDYWLAVGALSMHRNNDFAVRCFMEAVRREPHSMDAHFGLVASLDKLGEADNAELFRSRNSQIDGVNLVVKGLRESSAPTPNQIVEISEKLVEIGRPLESIAWQELALRFFNPKSPQLRDIPKYKKVILKELPSGRDKETIFCGLDPENYPSPAKWLSTLTKSGSDSLNVARSDTQTIPEAKEPVFANVANSVGIKFRYRNAAEPVAKVLRIFEAFGAGIACVDFDRDGKLDFYIGQAGAEPIKEQSKFANGLFRNLDGSFSDVVEQSGADDRDYAMGVTAGDWNQDGFADLLIGNLGQSRLLVNQGDGTFVEHTGFAAGKSSLTSSVAIADVTGDALPDLIEINYIDDPTLFDPIEYNAAGKPKFPAVLQYHSSADVLHATQKDGAFLSQQIGEQKGDNVRAGMALLVTDIDGSEGNEIFVANDLYANQYWIRNSSNGQWSDTASARGVAYGSFGKPLACMGIAAADFDGNGHLDIHISNFAGEWSNHYMQTESGLFQDSTSKYSLDVITQPMLGFGSQAIDYDNNTSWDLMIGNGHIEDFSESGRAFKMPTQVIALTKDGFEQKKVSGDGYWQQSHLSRSMAKCDFNRDGRIDMIVSDLQEDVALLENRTDSGHHWLQLELVGTESERDAIGARVVAHFGGRTVTQIVQSGDGYMAKNESILCFGLGKQQKVEKLEVRWPNGKTQTFDQLTADHRFQLTQGSSMPWLLW